MERSTTNTTSLPAAAFAVAHGVKLPRLEPIGPDRFQFSFDDDAEGIVPDRIHDYFSGASVSGREFFRALSDIRGAIRRTKQGGAR
jgi:hypothetical protein